MVEETACICYDAVMECDEAISRLQQHETDLKRLGVERLYMFGLTARDSLHKTLRGAIEAAAVRVF